MTKEETIKMLAILKAAYPNSYKGMTKDEANGTVMIWSSQFSKMPGTIVMIAVNKLISTNPFPPSISEVKEKIRSIYWEAEGELSKHRVIPCLTEQEVAMYKEIRKFCSTMQTMRKIEPSIKELLPSYTKYLEGDK